MNRLIATALPLVLITSCSEQQKEGTTMSGDREYTRICIDNVQYLYGVRGHGHVMTAHLKPNGLPYTCTSK